MCFSSTNSTQKRAKDDTTLNISTKFCLLFFCLYLSVHLIYLCTLAVTLKISVLGAIPGVDQVETLFSINIFHGLR